MVLFPAHVQSQAPVVVRRILPFTGYVMCITCDSNIMLVQASGRWKSDQVLLPMPDSRSRNLTSTGSKEAAWHLTTLATPRHPMLLQVLMGWAGASDRTLSKFSDVLAEQGLISLRSVQPVSYLFAPTEFFRRRWALSILGALEDLALSPPRSDQKPGTQPTIALSSWSHSCTD